MAEGIGAQAAPMQAIGSMLAQGGGGQAPQPDQMLKATVGKIRDIGAMVQQIASEQPLLAELAQQIDGLLKQMVITSAQQQSAQTASGLAVPGAGGGA